MHARDLPVFVRVMTRALLDSHDVASLLEGEEISSVGRMQALLPLVGATDEGRGRGIRRRIDGQGRMTRRRVDGRFRAFDHGPGRGPAPTGSFVVVGLRGDEWPKFSWTFVCTS